MGLEPSMDRYRVKETRELIDGGFYDDPELLDVLLEHCVEAILSRIASQGVSTIEPLPQARLAGTGRYVARPQEIAIPVLPSR